MFSLMTRLQFILLSLLLVSGIASGAPPAKMLSVPKPVYPKVAIQRHIQGRGLFRIYMDITTGKPLRTEIVKSTGSPLLDDAALSALRQWRAAPGTIRVINLPVTFTLSSNGASVSF
jgi:TonB family protein